MDALKITILEDGTIKTETDQISAANHQSAEAFLKDVTALAGGQMERKRRQQQAQHHHHTHQEQKQ